MRPVPLPLLLVLAALLVLSGCSIKRMAANGVANALTSGEDVFATDDDPELVREALPFGLKTIESLLQIVPENRNLLLAATRGFTQYAYAFVQGEAAYVEAEDFARAQEMRDRALNLYLRARGYGLRGLELRHRGIATALPVKPDSVVAKVAKRDQDLLYWTAAAWGAAIGVGKDRPELTADVHVVRAMMTRALALDERFDGGAIHEAMVILEAAPAMMGGSLERAKVHYDQALALSQGKKAGPYVTWAENVSVQTQNRAEFTRLLEQAIALDPDADRANRLANRVLQKRARWLLAHADDLFLDGPADEGADAPTSNEKDSR